MPFGGFQADLPRPSPRLEREIELGAISVRLSEWPGRRGPLVCLDAPAEALAEALAPEWRVLQVPLRAEAAYQVQASESVALLETFGFRRSVLLGEGLAAGVALLAAAWHPARVAGLVLVSPRRRPAALEPAALRAWLDAPPRWNRLLAEVRCPTLRLSGRGPRRNIQAVRRFLDSAVQSDACY